MESTGPGATDADVDAGGVAGYSDLTTPGGTRLTGTPAATAHPLVRVVYTYFYLPVLALAVALTLNIFLQLFFVSVLPLLDALPSETLASRASDAAEVAANVALVVLFPYPATRVLTNVMSLTLDSYSPYEHPYARRKIVALAARSSPLLLAALAAAAAVAAAAGPAALLPQYSWLVQCVAGVFAVHAVHVAAVVAAHVGGLWGHAVQRRRCYGWDVRLVARAKTVHVVASLIAGVIYADDWSSPMHVISCILLLATATTSALVLGYLAVKLAYEVTSTRSPIVPYTSSQWIGSVAASVLVVAVVSVAHRSLYLSLLTAGGLGVVVYSGLTRAIRTNREIMLTIPERRHIIFSVYVYRTLMYGGLVALGALIVATHIQEAAVVDTCFLAPQRSKYEMLALSTPHPEYAAHARARAAVYGSRAHDGYLGCGLRVRGLDLVQLGLLADLATAAGQGSCWNTSRAELLAGSLPRQDWVELGASSPDAWVGFVHVHSPSRNLHVVAIRGTVPHRFIDLIQDLSLYSSVIALQGISFMVPLTAWPQDAIAALVRVGSLIHDVFPAAVSPSDREYFHSVQEYITDYTRDTQPDASFMLVGHSLGGALSKIVGARLGLPAVAFSSPGIVLSRHKFGVSLPDIHASAVNIVPENDLVPRVDVHGGTVVHVECGSPSPGKCHQVERTVCELNARCGLGYEHLACDLFDTSFIPSGAAAPARTRSLPPHVPPRGG